MAGAVEAPALDAVFLNPGAMIDFGKEHEAAVADMLSDIRFKSLPRSGYPHQFGDGYFPDSGT